MEQANSPRSDQEAVCPVCGKEMVEEAEFPGLWVCVDGKVPINHEPPYQWKCRGMVMTEEGAEAFEKELYRQFVERN